MFKSFSSYSIQFQHHKLILLPQKAIYWPNKKALLIADLHFAKAAHFRKNGIAVSSKIHQEDLIKLDELIQQYACETVFFLGDLMHSTKNHEWDTLGQWIKTHSCQFMLIPGNHDFLDKKQYYALGLQILSNEHVLEQIILTHEPPSNQQYIKTNHLYISGHLHPGIKLKMQNKEQLMTSAFLVSAQQIILPAFGAFTGLHLPANLQKYQAYAIVSDKIVLIQ